MSANFRALLENLVEEVLDANQYIPPGVQSAITRANAALAEAEPEPEGPVNWPAYFIRQAAVQEQELKAALVGPEPQRRYVYNPVQIAECGGPCQQGPEYCDCGELWVAKPEPEGPTDEELEEEFGRALLKLPGDSMNATAVAFARAVLTRWGQPS